MAFLTESTPRLQIWQVFLLLHKTIETKGRPQKKTALRASLEGVLNKELNWKTKRHQIKKYKTLTNRRCLDYSKYLILVFISPNHLKNSITIIISLSFFHNYFLKGGTYFSC